MSDTTPPADQNPPGQGGFTPQSPNDNWPDFSVSGPNPAYGQPGQGQAQPGPGAGQGYARPAPGPNSGPAQAGYGQPGGGYPQPGYGRPGQVAPTNQPGAPATQGYPQPGYGPAGPGYPPPGYGQPGYGRPDWGPGGPQGPVTPNDTQMAMLAHMGAIILGFVPGLIVYLMKKDESPWARKHGAESLNFSITMAIASAVCVPLIFVFGLGALLLLVITVLRIVMGIIGGMAANRGETYEYPHWMRIPMFS